MTICKRNNNNNNNNNNKNKNNFPIVFCNRSFEILTGYNQKELYSKGFSLIQGPDTEQYLLDQCI